MKNPACVIHVFRHLMYVYSCFNSFLCNVMRQSPPYISCKLNILWLINSILELIQLQTRCLILLLLIDFYFYFLILIFVILLLPIIPFVLLFIFKKTKLIFFFILLSRVLEVEKFTRK